MQQNATVGAKYGLHRYEIVPSCSQVIRGLTGTGTPFQRSTAERTGRAVLTLEVAPASADLNTALIALCHSASNARVREAAGSIGSSAKARAWSPASPIHCPRRRDVAATGASGDVGTCLAAGNGITAATWPAAGAWTRSTEAPAANEVVRRDPVATTLEPLARSEPLQHATLQSRHRVRVHVLGNRLS